MALSNTLAKRPMTESSVGLRKWFTEDWKDFFVIEEVWKVTNLKADSTEQMLHWINFEYICRMVMQNIPARLYKTEKDES